LYANELSTVSENASERQHTIFWPVGTRSVGAGMLFTGIVKNKGNLPLSVKNLCIIFGFGSIRHYNG
jgi:hypothetical protein